MTVQERKEKIMVEVDKLQQRKEGIENKGCLLLETKELRKLKKLQREIDKKLKEFYSLGEEQ